MRQGGEGRNIARPAALALGLGYVVAGAVGFVVTGFSGFVVDTDERLLGLDLNVFHNIVHLAIGAGLIAASALRNLAVTQGVLMGVGAFYLVATLLGFANYLQIISIDASIVFDNFLHLATGAAALGFGVLSSLQTDRSRQHTGATLPKAAPQQS